MQILYQNPGYDHSIDSILLFQTDGQTPYWSDALLYFYPQIDRVELAKRDLAGRRQDGGKSGFDILKNAGVRGLVSADNARIPGWRRVREFLRADGEEGAYFGIFSCCRNLIRTLPRLTFDPIKTEDAALTPHEYTHAPDALRYALASLPFLPGEEKSPREEKWSAVDAFFGKEKKRKDYLGFLKK